jgi:hypothetical protein
MSTLLVNGKKRAMRRIDPVASKDAYALKRVTSNLLW